MHEILRRTGSTTYTVSFIKSIQLQLAHSHLTHFNRHLPYLYISVRGRTSPMMMYPTLIMPNKMTNDFYAFESGSKIYNDHQISQNPTILLSSNIARSSSLTLENFGERICMVHTRLSQSPNVVSKLSVQLTTTSVTKWSLQLKPLFPFDSGGPT